MFETVDKEAERRIPRDVKKTTITKYISCPYCDKGWVGTRDKCPKCEGEGWVTVGGR